MNQKHFISTTTMPVLVATGPGMVVMCNEELLSIKSHDLLITSCDFLLIRFVGLECKCLSHHQILAKKCFKSTSS